LKIAFITDDGKTISRHFGRARYYLVMDIEDGEVRNREMREKLGHFHFVNQENRDKDHGHGNNGGHGMDEASHRKHTQMAEAISDCEAIICGGMGMGAYRSMQTFNIKPIVTEILNIDDALQAFLDGNLKDQSNLVH
jgi:predicted Fe-Mo cluster-binding NifX family protein